MTDDDLHKLAANFQSFEYGFEHHTHYHFDYKGFARSIQKESRRAALEEVQSALSAERDMCSGSLDPYISSEYAARLDAKIDAIDGCIDAIRALSQKEV